MESIIARLKPLLEHDDRYQIISWLFLRLLALIYLSAFASLASQITGLVGSQGILPLDHHFALAQQHLGEQAWLRFPSIFWLIGTEDGLLQSAALLGVLLSLMLLIGRWQRAVLILLFLLYLSLYHAGQVFMNFQWDTLLLEAGFLAIFLVGGANPLLIFLFDWLLFRLRFMSGLFKLFSNDPSWSGFTALNHYFETQPLPHIGAWYAHQLPDLLLKAGVGLTLFSELIVPFFIFLPRKFRLAAAGITILMQLLIIATSNHNFINFLTIALCLFLLDDKLINSIMPARLVSHIKSTHNSLGAFRRVMILSCFVVIPTTSLISFSAKLWDHSVIKQSLPWAETVQQFGIGHLYHIFPTMQTQRHELIIQGSNDGREWLSYKFNYKPDEASDRLRINLPHQPRLDWMLWFVPTQHPVQIYWFDQFMRQIKAGSPSVTSLLENNPYPDTPPKYLRVLVYRYSFTNREERAQTGHWWKTEFLGEFPHLAPRSP
ncbi:MAG: lipase maturation factor family protein [Candidatus Thiodiazotropha taylori]|nr:lipase maturation factor family protein [Candidatus Thiodiazotropha taylori]